MGCIEQTIDNIDTTIVSHMPVSNRFAGGLISQEWDGSSSAIVYMSNTAIEVDMKTIIDTYDLVWFHVINSIRLTQDPLRAVNERKYITLVAYSKTMVNVSGVMNELTSNELYRMFTTILLKADPKLSMTAANVSTASNSNKYFNSISTISDICIISIDYEYVDTLSFTCGSESCLYQIC